MRLQPRLENRRVLFAQLRFLRLFGAAALALMLGGCVVDQCEFRPRNDVVDDDNADAGALLPTETEDASTPLEQGPN